MPEENEKEKVYVIPDETLKELDGKLSKICTGIECLPELSKKLEDLKLPETLSDSKKHQVFSFMSYCPECGEKLREAPPEFECSNCHVPVDPKKDKICWNCGSKKAKRRDLGE